MRDFEADRKLCDAATKGPWRVGNCENVIQTNHITRDVWQIPKTQKDLEFIAASRDGWPKALDRIVELENELLQKTQQVDELLQKAQRLEQMLVFAGTGFDVCNGCKWLGNDKICDRGIMPIGNQCRKQGFISWELR